MKFFLAPLLFILMVFSGCQSQRIVERTPQLEFIANRSKVDEIAYTSYFKPYHNPKNQLIVIDAGHGGEDVGTSSSSNPKYQEKSLNLSTSLFLKDYLQKMGYSVEMTRSNDTFIPLVTRSLIANNFNPRLFVSVHYNAALSEQPEGIEVFYFSSDADKDRTYQSKKLGETVLGRIIQKTKAKSRGLKHGNLSVIRETNMPAILVEGGFMTNKSEMEKIKDPAYIKQVAYGIALGIDDYVKGL